MPRIAEARPPAEPVSPRQRARRENVIGAAARLGADRGFDRVQMHEVAEAADVAIGTLYRYFPSKVHLFTAVLAERLDRLGEKSARPSGPGAGPEEAVGELLVQAGRHLLRQPLLARAMLHANNLANAAAVPDSGRIDQVFRSMVLRVLRVGEPTVQDVALTRLLGQCWYGGLCQCLNGSVSVPDMEHDIRVACRLLLASRSNVTAP